MDSALAKEMCRTRGEEAGENVVVMTSPESVLSVTIPTVFIVETDTSRGVSDFRVLLWSPTLCVRPKPCKRIRLYSLVQFMPEIIDSFEENSMMKQLI